MYPDKNTFLNYNNKIKIIAFSNIEQAFKKYAKDSFLNFQSFNDSIGLLFHDENFPILSYTYLATRLFILLDMQQNGAINFDSFAKGICMALSTTETRAKILFEAMKLKPGRAYLDYEEVYDFFFNSWSTSFHYIYMYINYAYKQEFIQNNIPIPTNSSDFVGLVNLQRETLNNYLIQNLHDAGINYNEPITYELFRSWASKDNTLEINYANKWFRFAMNANYLEVIGLDITK